MRLWHLAAVAAVGFIFVPPLLEGRAATAPAQPSPALAKVQSAIAANEGKSVLQVGCPRYIPGFGSTLRGSGSVCCAFVVSQTLKDAGHLDRTIGGVMPLVRELKRRGWRQVPIDDAPAGSVVFYNSSGCESCVVNPGQHVELAAAPGATKTFGSWAQKAQTHEGFLTGNRRAIARKGGNFGGALVPPNR